MCRGGLKNMERKDVLKVEEIICKEIRKMLCYFRARDNV